MTRNEEMVIFTRTFDFLSWLLPMTADPVGQLATSPALIVTPLPSDC